MKNHHRRPVPHGSAESPAETCARDEARWGAVAGRDPKADGQFCYAVATTGIFCRPCCASRLPLRRNVTFYDTPALAEQAGFRPCKRCRPGGPALVDDYAAAVRKACRQIESEDEAPALHELARAAGMSPHHFHRIFKAATGVTPKSYATAHRAERVRRTLTSAGSVTQAIYEGGFASSAPFYAHATATLGMTPTVFRRGGAGETLRYATARCSLGAVIVAASGKGICAIFLGDDPEELVQTVRKRFPKAHLSAGDNAYQETVTRVVEFIEAPGTPFDLPLDIRGTAFQQQVWQALREVPAGATANYTDIARRIGLPKAVRAVAQACGANPVAVAVPCHRVLRLGGGLSGYRWGVERKRELLAREKPAHSV